MSAKSNMEIKQDFIMVLAFHFFNLQGPCVLDIGQHLKSHLAQASYMQVSNSTCCLNISLLTA
jgi:hypothetical protein